MKNKLITILVVLVLVIAGFIYFTRTGQLFGEKISIFGITFNAVEVTGQSKFIGNSDYYRTPILNPLITKKSDEYFYSLGSYRRNEKNMETLDLFNLSVQNNTYPFLDSIDFDYYRSMGFAEVEKNTPSLITDLDYRQFKSSLVDSIHFPIKERKRILFSSKELYRDLLIASRYEIFSNQFSVDKNKVSKATAELKAQLDTIAISSDIELSSSIRAYFSTLVDESTNLLGYYIDARLHPAYIDKINFYINNTPKITIGNDQFAFNLKNYTISENAAVNTSLVAIQLNGSFNKTKISIDSIYADLRNKFKIPYVDAKRIAMSVNLTFATSETTTFKNKFNNIFIIRYFTSSIIDDAKFLD